MAVKKAQSALDKLFEARYNEKSGISQIIRLRGHLPSQMKRMKQVMFFDDLLQITLEEGRPFQTARINLKCKQIPMKLCLHLRGTLVLPLLRKEPKYWIKEQLKCDLISSFSGIPLLF